MDVRHLAAIAIVFVVAGIALGIGAEVLSEVKDSTTGSTADAAIENATLGIGKLAKWMPTIGLVIAAAIVIGVVVRSFAAGRGGI